ncbi:unnamed protein product, partial [Polarella glacialis]
VSGVLLVGGRAAAGFQSDVWKYEFSGEFCSLDWQGTWSQVTASAAWNPRHGHSLVGFAAPFSTSSTGSSSATTILMIGGYGGQEIRSSVRKDNTQNASDTIMARNDIWCASRSLNNFATWRRLAPNAPFTPRSQAVAVIAPTIAEFSMIFFGGYDERAQATVDLWRWSGENSTADCGLDNMMFA